MNASPQYPLRAEDATTSSQAFLMVSSVLDMALAAADAAEALENSRQDPAALAAVVACKGFLRDVRHMTDDEEGSRPVSAFHIFGNNGRWHGPHRRFFQQAKECHRLLGDCSPWDNARFNEYFGRLTRKIEEAEGLRR